MPLASTLDMALNEVERFRRSPSLTPREYQVARLVALARTNRQIANELVITVPTVERHVTNILQKLILSSRSELVRWIVANEDAANT
jgi:DNA-binding NarL/FixJ family response regulator